MPLPLTILISLCWTCATLKLPKIMTSNMVLAAERPKVFGWASKPSSIITGTMSDTGETVSFRTTKRSQFFEIEFKPRAASMVPFSITLTEIKLTQRPQSIVLTNLLAGDIWVCSGQSNMEFSVAEMFRADEIIEKSRRKGIRLFAVQKNESEVELKDVIESQYPTGWVEASPQTVCGAEFGSHDDYCRPHCSSGSTTRIESFLRPTWGYFSAVCFAYGLELLEATGRPQGLVEACKGGSKILQWSSASVLEQCGGTPDVEDEISIGPLWASMVAPLLSVPTRGVLWYQGEGEATAHATSSADMSVLANRYQCRLQALIKNWRSRFAKSSGELTWITVQLSASGDISGGALRLAQQSTTGLPKVGLAVTTDLSDKNSPCGAIHSRKKSVVAHRAALASLHLAYNRRGVHWTGPMPNSVVQTSDGVRVNFFGGDGALKFTDVSGQTIKSKLQGFEVTTNPSLKSGWMPVSARISSKSSVMLKTSGAVIGVRYSWGAIPDGQFLYDEADLPTGPFLVLCGPERAECKLIEGGHVPTLDERFQGDADAALLSEPREKRPKRHTWNIPMPH